ncbi:hypothetical protein PTI97_11010 [Exiguobacterium marinum]|uniref:TolA-binding protein n=1 Tax=Exiguobacterium marinum TaxID=273528 RepID=A0ABY7WYH9_9BACL|nr:hypothetical protein [Exiguobacterium marinum]WDH75347.1 hypothetical protein PTI97_11010 [Exiguobacterium marinum]
MSSESQSILYLQEASTLVLTGQPFQAYAMLSRQGLKQSDLGQLLEEILPDYEKAMGLLDQFQQHLPKELHRAHQVSKELPDLIYPESLQMQRLSVAVLQEDQSMIHYLLEQLPDRHPFRTQVESLLTLPNEGRKKSIHLLPVVATLLLTIGGGYWVYQNGQSDIQAMSSKVDEALASENDRTLEIERLKQELQVKETLIESLEKKYEEELALLGAKEEETSQVDGDLSGFVAYSEGRYEEAAELLEQMNPIGFYNQETIDFYKLMASYKTNDQTRDILDQFESKYPASDYLGDAYFSYYIALVKQNGTADQLASEINSRFSDHWFINAL